MDYITKDIKTELKDLRDKIKLIKKNNIFPKRLKIRQIWKNNDILNAGESSDYNEIMEENHLVSKEEAKLVKKCYKKSLILLKNFTEQKKIKKLQKLNITNSIQSLETDNINKLKTVQLAVKPSKQGRKITKMKQIKKLNCINNNSKEFEKLLHCQNHSTSNNSQNIDNAVVCLQNRNCTTDNNISKRKTKNLTECAKSSNNKTSRSSSVSGNRLDNYSVSNPVSTVKSNQKLDRLNYKHQKSEDLDVIFIQSVNNSSKVFLTNHEINNQAIKATETSNYNSNVNMCTKEVILPERNNQSFEIQDLSSKNTEITDLNISQISLIDVLSDEEEYVIPEWDFKEEPIDFPLPCLHADEKLRVMSEQEIKSLESKGVIIRTGRWLKEEEDILRRNFKDFTTRFQIKDASLLLGIGRRVSASKFEYGNVQRFLKAKHFHVRLGKDLNHRTLWNIYIKARFVFDPIQRKGNCIVEDVPKILELQKKYGNNWYLIGKKVGRPPNYCHRICSYYGKCIIKGKWSEEEIKTLISAIKKVTKISDLTYESVKRIPWNKVSELVPNRNADQCLREWHLNQAFIITNIKYQDWNRECASKLIYLLKNENVNNEKDINWNNIYEHFRNVMPTCTALKHKWYNNIRKYIPENFKSNYTDMMEYLVDKYCRNMN